MTIDSYCDLESSDDETFLVPSLRQLAMLGQVVGVQPRVLLLGPEAENLNDVVTPADTTARLAERMSREGLTPEQLGDQIGWDIKEVLLDGDAVWEFTVDELYDICEAIGLDWVAALPVLERPLLGESE